VETDFLRRASSAIGVESACNRRPNGCAIQSLSIIRLKRRATRHPELPARLPLREQDGG